MIVREDGPDYLLVRQADHARLSGELAERWGGSAFEAVEDASVLLGARLHDLAWEDWDEAPAQGDDGRPLAFHEVDRVTTTDLYDRGVKAVLALDAHAALLVSLHFSGFFHGHWDWLPFSTPERFAEPEATALRLFVQDQLAFQEEVRARLELTGEAADRRLSAHYKWLQLWDRVSLDCCRRDPASGWAETYPAVPAAWGAPATVELRASMPEPGRCVLEPYPLRDSPFRGSLTAARVPKSACRDRAIFLAAYRDAQREDLRFTFVPSS